MESQPIVTCHGNQVLFSSLHPTVVQGLPKEPAEWRRSYGRPARNVYLEASFVPYDDDILPEDTDKTLISRPYFHIYWTDCDLETYKSSVKEEITDWCAALKNKNIPDWLIIVVINEENKKSKLLPRSSVYDKVKSDFCSKYSDRCMVLTDPLKSDGKSLESWNAFLARLRQLLLQAYSRHLQKFEDNMRALREKRNELGWNFHEYFIVQEELAFMFEMLGLFDDALIQYDELDALFTQFVLNHASGGARKFLRSVTNKSLDYNPLATPTAAPVSAEAVQWLKSLIQPCTSWAGLSLQKSIDWDRRNQIKDNTTSLLDFRNYLFARQCALLILMKKPAELIQRAMEYLHNTVQEIKTLEIDIPEGGLDCWVFLSGLEVLRKCEKMTDTSQPKVQDLNTANLWDYVCRKLRRLGELCGLMPGMSQHPTSDQLQLVIDLTAGMGLKATHSDGEVEDKNQPVPRDKLREALSSKESFQKIYLEQSELAMGTFKHIGRFRSARMIGKNLADFYMKLGEPQKAENYLLDAMKMYREEGWKYLTDMSRLDLARCQHEVGDQIKYLKTACRVVASPVIDISDRQYHMGEVMKIAKTKREHSIVLKASPILHLEVLNIDHETVTAEEPFQIELQIVNQSPIDLPCDSIWLTLVEDTSTSLVKHKRLDSVKTLVSRQSSDALLDKRIVMNKKPIKKRIPSEISLEVHYERSHSSIDKAGIACINTHELLKRADSNQSEMGVTEEKIHKDTVSQCFNMEDIMLTQGENRIKFTCQSIKSGCFKPGQFGVKINSLELLKDLQSDLSLTVASEECHIEIIPESLLAGILQEVNVILHTGSAVIEAGSKVTVVPSSGLQVENKMAESGTDSDTVILEEAERDTTVEWKMSLLQEPNASCGLKLENKVAFDCSWLPRPLLTSITFLNPFHLSHKIHTSGNVKYAQVCIHGNTEEEFEMSDWELKVTNTKDVEVLRLNKPGQVLKVNTEQSCSCMWQVKSNIPEFPALDLTFTMEYCCLSGQDQKKRSLSYSFNFENYQTLYNVTVDVKPKGDNKVCLTGSLACMKFQVHQMPVVKLPQNQELMYEINTDQSVWAIQGKSTGVFTMSEERHSVELDVMPLITGFLPLPRLKLLKYLGKKNENKKDKSQKKTEVEDFMENLESTDEEDSDNEASRTPATEIEFNQGQVYYSSLGKQVHVYPENVSGDVELTII